jgi:hypothetical protein
MTEPVGDGSQLFNCRSSARPYYIRTDEPRASFSGKVELGKALVVALCFAGLAAFVGPQSALADCRSENAACMKGATSPFDSVACGSLFRSCAANHASRAAQEHAKQMQNANKPALQSPAPAGGPRSGRR